MTDVVELSETELDELRSAVRSFLEAKSPEEAVRKTMESEPRYDPQVWAQMAEQLRLPGLAIPEEYGGDGFGQVALGAVLEEMGRALVCSPFFATVVLAARALLASGDSDACARHLPGIAAGTTTAALAVAERTGAWDPVQITTRAVRRSEAPSGGWELTGTKSFVIDGASADLLLVIARTTAGPSLFTVDRGAPGLTAEPMETLDATRAMARLRLDGTPATPVGTDGAGGRLMARVLDFAALGLAAEQTGGAARCLESSTAYAGTRVQFGRLIGSFQAVKHKCADMLVQLELARAAAREAARLADLGDEGFAVAAAAAHLTCSRAYMFAATENIQVHGGIGFTWEHPAHLYFRRAKSSQLLFGGPSASHERLLERLGI
ncbi:acyl-CoA dehydrogenase family protein [Actinomadura rugatobispora]|uniref:Acyl-CoA dehydrogenase family protein n=1 Tax=Actinomadura rugatobispora TaxID=1994 RepID=A0ABW1A478_9ACTN|nr:acyl-CoA dehydrogenase family protein [Actinomadura rugatobispora]